MERERQRRTSSESTRSRSYMTKATQTCKNQRSVDNSYKGSENQSEMGQRHWHSKQCRNTTLPGRNQHSDRQSIRHDGLMRNVRTVRKRRD